jgi:transcriptional regulator with XRE-family HTH domain
MDAAKRRAKLGAELRNARAEAGMTQTQAAAALGCRQGKINKIETSQCAISPKDLSKLLAIYEVRAERRAEIRQLATHAGPGVPAHSRSNTAYLAMRAAEQRAAEVLSLHSERIPGLLQSEHYMLKQYALAGDGTDLATLLLDRQERAQVFANDDGPRYRAILSESSLHRLPGGRQPILVIDQAQHLLSLCESHAQLSVQILTFDADIPYLDTDFTVLTFGGREKDIAYVENVTEGRIIRGARPVADRLEYWQGMRHAALSPEESTEFLRDLIEKMRVEMVAEPRDDLPGGAVQ